MNHHLPETKIPAPCIVNTGVIVNKLDMRRLLGDLGRVRYAYTQDGEVCASGEGDVMEVFANPRRSTLVANNALYLNVYSFDCLELTQSSEKEACFDLVQEGMRLRLTPLSTPMQERQERCWNTNAIEAMMEQVLSAKWDAEIDDDSSDMF
ncbi:hypothetical protein [Calothrix sp. CCY 0018]|uniref:hypothetical protein n=1 Tax=Calothrix sp. CCY 0018 TaxID=3103864 RepID=UPI0039C6333D